MFRLNCGMNRIVLSAAAVVALATQQKRIFIPIALM